MLYRAEISHTSPDSNVLLECMSNLTANEMYQPGGAGERTVHEILEGVRQVKEKLCKPGDCVK